MSVRKRSWAKRAARAGAGDAGSGGGELALTLDPDEAIEEVEAAAGVGAGPPVRPPDLVGLLREAGVLPDLVHDMRGQRAVPVGLEDDACGQWKRQGARCHHRRDHTSWPAAMGRDTEGFRASQSRAPRGLPLVGTAPAREATWTAGSGGRRARTAAGRCAQHGSARSRGRVPRAAWSIPPPSACTKAAMSQSQCPQPRAQLEKDTASRTPEMGRFPGTYWQRQ